MQAVQDELSKLTGEDIAAILQVDIGSCWFFVCML
jgi:hypothetical protein